AKSSRSKTRTVLDRSNKSLEHLSVNVISANLIQLRQPEVIAGMIRILRVIGNPAQVAKVLHQNNVARKSNRSYNWVLCRRDSNGTWFQMNNCSILASVICRFGSKARSSNLTSYDSTAS